MEQGEQGPGTYGEPVDIVLVTVDTLRADHLGCYGYPRDTTPNLDRLAEQALVFERAYATSGTTIPSHLSLLTGLYPHQHGYLRNHHAVGNPVRDRPGARPVAAVLGEGGWTTAAFVSAAPVSRRAGFETGFQVFGGPGEEANRRAEHTTRQALSWLETQAGARPGSRPPFLLWVHYWDPHEPNAPPEPYASRFASPPAGSPTLERLIDERAIHPAELERSFTPQYIARHFFVDAYRGPIRRGEPVDLPPVGREQVADLLGRYDGDVAYVDHWTGELIAGLRRLGLWERTIFCFTADHGQGLGQHDWLEHGTVRGEIVRVPWILRLPGGLVEQPARVSRVVSSVDLMPTLLARIDQRAARQFQAQAAGVDVLAPDFDRRFAFSQRSSRTREWGAGSRYALTFEGWKYYRDGDGGELLYDLVADPGETRDVAAAHPGRLAELRRIVADTLLSRPAPAFTTEVGDDEEARRFAAELEALGYGGGD